MFVSTYYWSCFPVLTFPIRTCLSIWLAFILLPFWIWNYGHFLSFISVLSSILSTLGTKCREHVMVHYVHEQDMFVFEAVHKGRECNRCRKYTNGLNAANKPIDGKATDNNTSVRRTFWPQQQHWNNWSFQRRGHRGYCRLYQTWKRCTLPTGQKCSKHTTWMLCSTVMQ